MATLPTLADNITEESRWLLSVVLPAINRYAGRTKVRYRQTTVFAAGGVRLSGDFIRSRRVMEIQCLDADIVFCFQWRRIVRDACTVEVSTFVDTSTYNRLFSPSGLYLTTLTRSSFLKPELQSSWFFLYLCRRLPSRRAAYPAGVRLVDAMEA